jgi:ankyrin repeat protein
MVINPRPEFNAPTRRRLTNMRHSINKNIEGHTPLMHAAFDGQLVRVISLLSEGADPNARDSGGETALMFAAMGGHLLVAKTLLGHGADPTLPARNGWKALQFAVSRGHHEVASLLTQAEQSSYREGMPILRKGAGRD